MIETTERIERTSVEKVADEIRAQMEWLDERATFHTTELAKCRKAQADLRDMLSSRTRKVKTGQFSTPRKRRAKKPDATATADQPPVAELATV